MAVLLSADFQREVNIEQQRRQVLAGFAKVKMKSMVVEAGHIVQHAICGFHQRKITPPSALSSTPIRAGLLAVTVLLIKSSLG
jgi:hypothetical protein